MKVKALQIRDAVFCGLIFIFAVLVAGIVTGWGRRLGFAASLSAMAVLAGAFIVLAVALAVMTAKLKEPGIRKRFFMATGISAALIPICAILHNVVYGLCMMWFGRDFWKGGDEAVFFILAIFVFPAMFVLGTTGSIVLLVSATLGKKES